MFVKSINVVIEDKSAYFISQGGVELTTEKNAAVVGVTRTMAAGESESSPRFGFLLCRTEKATLPVSPQSKWEKRCAFTLKFIQWISLKIFGWITLRSRLSEWSRSKIIIESEG